MFDERSRYFGLPSRVHVMPDGRRVAYVVRRIVPPADAYVAAAAVVVTDSDRIDHLAQVNLGHSGGFWQIADANEATHPLTLVMQTGRRLAIPLPRTGRTRR